MNQDSDTQNRADIGSAKSPCAPGFVRRLAIISYDAFLLLAVLFVAALIALAVNAGNSFSPGQILFQLYLLIVSFVFFGWFWTHGGQTLGLRAWKTKVLDQHGQVLNWQQALVRFCWALLSWSLCGLGFIWILFDKDNLAWHDRLSKTRLYHLKSS